MTAQNIHAQSAQDERKEALGQRLDAIGWGLFLIMLGGLWLAPEEWGIPEATWLLGTGIIILGLNLARYMNGLQVSGFWLFLGALALGSGLADVLGLDLPVFPILIIIVGAGILMRLFLHSRRE